MAQRVSLLILEKLKVAGSSPAGGVFFSSFFFSFHAFRIPLDTQCLKDLIYPRRVAVGVVKL